MYSIEGAPQAASSSSCWGLTPPQLSLFAHKLGQLLLPICIIYMLGVLTATKVISPCEPTHDRPMIKDWHGVCARVRPCSVAKPKGRALSHEPFP